MRNLVGIVEMDDHGMVGGPAFGGKDTAHGVGIAGVRAESVDGFGGERDELAGAQEAAALAMAAGVGASMAVVGPAALMICRLHPVRPSGRGKGDASFILLEFGIPRRALCRAEQRTKTMARERQNE